MAKAAIQSKAPYRSIMSSLFSTSLPGSHAHPNPYPRLSHANSSVATANPFAH
jgi:hypothetical protein